MTAAPYSTQHHGFILLPVILAITLVAAIAFIMNYESVGETHTVGSELQAVQARYVTEAALNHAQWQVEQAGCGPYTDIAGQTFGKHSYSATITPNNAAGVINTYTVSVTDDAWINDDTPTQSYANDAELSAYKTIFPASTRRALYRFDIANAGIPAGSTVTSAVAKIFVTNTNETGPVTVHQITSDWTEATVNWDNINSSYDASALATIPSNPPIGQYVLVNITPLVQAWINGTTTNQGIMLLSDIFLDSAKFSSKEYAIASQRPQLEVTTTDSPPPNRADIYAIGTLDNGMTHNITKNDLLLYQNQVNTLELQPDATEAKDTYIYEWQPNWNHGAKVSLSVSDQWNANEQALLNFDLSAIPRGAQINEATLELHSKGSSWPSTTLTVHRLNNAWSEGSETGGAGAGATWDNRDSTTAWNSPGGDYELNPAASAVTPGAIGWVSWDIAQLVDDWVNTRSPNYGLLLAPTAPGQGADFDSSDATDTAVHPKITITYSCECGISCQAPQGSGKILMAVINPSSLVPADARKKSLFESWGYTVNIISESANQSTYDAEAMNNDVIYISNTVNSSQLGSILSSQIIGVINEAGDYNADLGTSSGASWTIGSTFDVIDTSHYITALFSAGSLPIYSADMEGLQATGTLAADLQSLGNLNNIPALAVVETGGVLTDGSTAAGRRVMLPIGRNGSFNWDYLNNNGRLIVQRAIQWGTGNDGIAPILIYRDEFSKRNCDAADYIGSNGAQDWSPWTWVETGDDGSSCGGNFAIAEDPEVIEPGNFRLKLSGNNISIARQVDLSGFVQAHLSFDFRPHTINNNNSIIIQAWDETGGIWVELDRITGPLKEAAYASTSYDISPYISASAAIRFFNSGLGVLESLYIDNVQISETAPPLPEPIAHWMLDEVAGITAVDSAGGHDGTLLNSPLWAAGQVNGGLNFDGTDDYINIPHSDTLSLTEKLTFMAWINPASTGTSYNTVLAKDGGIGDSNFWFGLYQDELDFGFFSGGFYRDVFTTDLNIPSGSWQHIAVSFNNAADEVLLYFNGTLVHTAAFSFIPTVVTAELSIARSPDGEYWHGLLDDVRIYNTVLSSTQIADIFTAGGGGGITPEPGNCDGTFRDEFNTVSYAANNGTLIWAGNWLESGDIGGESSGDLMIMNDLGDNRLTVMDKDNSIEREANLSGAAAAQLTFDYRRVGLDSITETISIEVSADGGSSWTTLQTFSGPDNDTAYLSSSVYDITKFIAANTRIRFITSSKPGNGEGLFVDNIEIQCSP